MYYCVVDCRRGGNCSIVNFPSSLSETQVRRAISDALHVWSDASLLTFHELRSASSSSASASADISIQFHTGRHGDGYPFDGPGESAHCTHDCERANALICIASGVRSGAGTRWNAVPANILEPERCAGKYRWPQVER